MPGKIGTGYIDVGADLTRFWRELEGGLGGSDLESAFKSVGTRSAKAFSSGAGDTIEKDLRRTTSRMKVVADASGKEIADGITRGLRDAKKEINAFARDGNASFALLGKGVDSSVSGSLQAVAKRINLFARDGNASLRTLGTTARGVGAELTGSFDPASKALQRAGADITGALEHVGKAVRGVSSDATGGIGPASSKLNAFGRDGSASFSAVGTSARRADADLKSLYAGITRSNISRALGDSGRAANRAGDEIRSATARGTAGLRGMERATNSSAKGLERLVTAGGGGRGISSIARTLDGFGGSFTGGVAAVGGLRIALVALVPMLFAFGGATVAAGAALIPLAGLLAAAANAAGAAAQGFGVLKLAFAGIGAALKEQITNQTTAGGAAAQSAGQQRAAARAIQSAQDGIRTALEGVRKAALAVSDAHRTQRAALAALAPAISAARMHLTDLREAASDAARAIKDSKLSAQEARKALADLLTGPSPRVLADAHHAVTDALRGEESAARALSDAHEGVSSALRGEQDAVQALTDAHKALDDLLKPPDVLDLADANDAVADSLRNEEQAQLDLADQAAKTQAVLQSAGVTDVFGAGGLQQRPTVTEAQKARARLDLANAENAVGDATRATQRAKQALAKLEAPPDVDVLAAARRRVADAENAVAQAARSTVTARQQVSDAENGVAEAARQTSNAREDLASLETPASAEEIARARLTVAEAEDGVSDATRDHTRAVRELADAERLGIRGSKDVVDARTAIRDANLAVAEADHNLADAERSVKRATESLSDAQLSAKESAAQLASASANLNKKFDSLPPAAQKFVRVLIDMKPKLDELRQTAAAGFFPGATDGLKAAAKNFDSVNKVVGETATVMGEASRKTGELVGSPAFGHDLETIGHNNAKVIDTLGEALRHVVSAIRNVMVSAGPLTQWLADTINKWSQYASNAAKAGRESGAMAAFFDKTRAILERLGSIIGHVAHGLLGVGEAGSESGNSIWASIDKASKRFDKWANSTQGQKALKDFFKETKDLAAAIVPIFKDVAGAFAFVTLKMLPLTEALRVLGPLANEATTAFIAYKLAALAAGVASSAAAFAMGGWVTTFWALDAAMVALPLVGITAGIIALGAGLIYAYTHVKVFHDAVDSTFEWIKAHWPLLAEILTGPIGFAVIEIVRHWDDIKKAFTDGLNAVIGIIKGFANALVSVGSWIIGKIVEGIKGVINFAADVGGYVKNRVVEGIQAFVDAFVTAGSWIVNRIADGIKTVTDLLGTVGGWLKNRIEELIHNEVDALKSIGSWALNRIVDGITTVTDALSGIGGWLKNRVTDFIGAAKDDFVGVGKSIMNFIVDGLKSGGRELLGFVNDIIDVINGLLGAIGVDKIGHVSAKSVGLARGGVVGMANGGAFARTAGFIDRPMVMMGEEAPRHPEYVIPTNPAYRDRAQSLLGEAAGVIGMADGGVISDFREAIKRTHASAKPALALFEAGVVESNLENLTGGDRDSRGALQVRDATARGMGLNNMDPLAVALAFLTRGYWGKGGGISLSASHPSSTAGWVAQQVQGSAFPLRYDQARSQALQYMGAPTGGGGGILGAITGAIGDLLSKGVNFILDKLPGVGHLPDWLKGVGSFLIDKAGGFVSHKAHELTGLARGGTLGSFHTGTGFVQQSGAYELERGEAVIPASHNQPTAFHVYVGERELTDIVKVEIERDGRRMAGAWNAGVIT